MDVVCCRIIEEENSEVWLQFQCKKMLAYLLVALYQSFVCRSLGQLLGHASTILIRPSQERLRCIVREEDSTNFLHNGFSQRDFPPLKYGSPIHCLSDQKKKKKKKKKKKN